MANINWKLLQTWSPERAWWHGIFLGDGCAPSSGYLLQCTGAISTITRWRALITDDTRPFYEHKHAPGAFVAVVRSRALSDWMLQVHGYRGKKSDKLRWPEDLPKACLPHFIRGLWDSDGCIYVQKTRTRGNKQRSLVYTSIAVPFVERLGLEIEKALGIPVPKLNRTVVPQSGNVRVQLSYTGALAQKFADWLYKDAPEHIRNEDRMGGYHEMCALQEAVETPCACGNPRYTASGLCRACWEATQTHTTGPGTVCGTEGCTREVWAKGLCGSCLSAERIHQPGYRRPVQGACQCGATAYRKGLCDACYERQRRGRPLRGQEPVAPVVLAPSVAPARCPCGAEAKKKGFCVACFYASRPRRTGEGTVCPCGRGNPVQARGKCGTCLSAERRADPKYQRHSSGVCACGRPAFRKGQCDACYARTRRSSGGVACVLEL